jgi:3-oxoacyl-[acyl-carrier-protein] synthase-1
MKQGLPTAFPITAYTLCNALGLTTAEVLKSLRAGESGLRPGVARVPFETAAGALPEVLPALPESLSAFDTLQTRMLVHLLRDLDKPLAAARARWGADRVGIALGTSTAGIDESEQAHAFYRRHGKLPERYDFARQHPPDAMIEVVRALTGLGGPGLVVSTACSSSAKVFGVARRWLRSGVCDAVLVGGVDTLCQVTVRGFKSLALLSTRPCRPFAADRDGISIGEGGALLLLEREGDGPARLLGVGETSDAHHMTAPHPAGLGAVASMSEALAQAGLAAGEVDHINAHGTATPLNDAAEGLAIAALFGDRVPVVSTKGYTGHMLGAAGATEAVFSIAAIAQGWLPASLGAENLDPALPIQIVRKRMERPIRVVLSNSFAFGGNNACVAFGAAT